MLPDQPADILSVRSRFAAETGRIRGVADRQLAAVEDLAAMQVRQRHFGRGNEIQIPIAADLEQVLLELRELAGTLQRLAVGEKRRLDLAIAMLARVQIEHEVDQRARQPCAGAAQYGEARAREPHTTLEVENAERRSEIPVRYRREIERPRRAVTPHFDVVR